MYLRTILIIFSAIFHYSCIDNTPSSNLLSEVKKLEFSRENNSASWKTLYEKANANYKAEIIASISKTKNDSLIPFLGNLLSRENDESLKIGIVFALGQTGSEKAESILLKNFTSTQSTIIKNEVLKALAQCGTNASIERINEALHEEKLQKTALQTAAILSRKKTDVSPIKETVSDSTWTHSKLKENAYFIYYSAEAKDLNLIISSLVHSADLSQKYYLKALHKILGTKSTVSLLKSDSLFLAEAVGALRSVLNGKINWQNKLHALKCFAHLADSTDRKLIKSFTKSKNINLRLEGFETYNSVFPEKSLTYILNTINSEKDFSIKGKLIGLVARQSPNTGFRLIQKNLDKGTISFKEDLLRALESYNNNFARNTLSGFLMVQEKRLVNLAFSILREKKQISLSHITDLMTTDHFSVLYNILDWQKEKKKYVSQGLLISAFVKFNQTEHSEAQELILDILQAKNKKMDATHLEELSFNLSTKKISEKFQTTFPNYKISKQLWKSSKPNYLSVDSVLTLPKENILVEISTNKGEIIVELFSQKTPQTVKNFLELAKNGFYDKLIFHRVIADFVIQGGDPAGDGWGGAGYTIASEDFVSFERGTIGIATSGFDTGSCQFFICQSEQPHLRGNYTAFGKVKKGLEVVDNIQIDDLILSIKPISQK